MKLVCCGLIGLLVIALPAQAEGPFTMEFEEVADNVWAGVRPDGHRYPVMGNTTFVIGDTGVVVFDGGGMPAMSELVIDKIQSLTDRPVTHVVISHWHGDHFFGTFRFAEEFPGVRFIAHEFTRKMINSTRINYVDRERDFLRDNRDEIEKIVEEGVDSEGETYNKVQRDTYQRMLDDSAVILAEFSRAKVIPPDTVFSDNYSIDLGDRDVVLMHSGHGNTEGDIVMWLPDSGVVATGDIVVLPSPYAFNVPPRPWAETLRAINALDYQILVPGHGPVQRNTDYVDLLIEVAESIAMQRDKMIDDGMSPEDVAEALDFSAFEQRFTHNDEYVRLHYDSWFEQPLRAAAIKALTGEPMVQVPPPEQVAFDSGSWQFSANEHDVVDYLGQRALRLKGGSAVLADSDILNGIIEFDIAIPESRGFAGVIFRMQDDANYENFYIRPHQSGNPDANQYQPVFNGVASWQLYHGAEYAAPVSYRHNEWMPVKIVFAGDQAQVYIDSIEPVLHIRNLKRDISSGAIGVSVADFAAVHFANFRYTPLAKAYMFAPTSAEATSAETISRWQVSDAFPHTSLDGVAELDESHMASRRWTPIEAEATGITNLAKVQGLAGDNDTVFAMVNLSADEPEIRQLEFGYSDVASVYLNGRLIYSGNNTYLSRDYRYLGTIGYFDKVPLRLQPGENELCIAVTEAFGGWGVMGRLTDLGI